MMFHSKATTAWICALFLASETYAGPAEDLEKLVNINSGTSHVVGVNQVQGWLKGQLDSLGFQTHWIEPQPVQPNRGKLLLAEMMGKDRSRFVTLVMHADTVFEPSSPFQKWSLSVDRKTATGPGVIDNKGGMIVALGGLRAFLAKTPVPPVSIRVVSSPSEETGSLGFVDAFKKWSRDSFLALGFEPALDAGDVISSRRGNRWYHIRVQGKEAHAGRAHRDGINACVELSRKLVAISALTNYAKNVTVSVGRMQGGQDKFNIVCGSAEAKVDTRFADLSSREALHRAIEKILKSGKVGETRYEIADDTPPYSETTQSKGWLGVLLGAVEKAEGRKFRPQMSGGAADINHFSRPGLAVIDGLGAVGGKMHTPDEFVVLESLKTRAQAFAELLSQLR